MLKRGYSSLGSGDRSVALETSRRRTDDRVDDSGFFLLTQVGPGTRVESRGHLSRRGFGVSRELSLSLTALSLGPVPVNSGSQFMGEMG